MPHTSILSAHSPHRPSAIWLWPLAAGFATLLSACGGYVEVGDAKEQVTGEGTSGTPNSASNTGGSDTGSEHTGNAGGGSSETTNSTGGTGDTGAGGAGGAEVDCSTEDAAARELYDAWVNTPNDFGELAGRTFTGYFEAGPDVTLTIEANHSATLVIGEPITAPPVADEGYLCGEDAADGIEELTACEDVTGPESFPVVGATYQLRGAQFQDGRLTVDVQTLTPWDDWCSLQKPVQQEPCFFMTEELGTFSFSPGGCTSNNSSVDCGWLGLAGGSVCDCTSTTCFSDIHTDADPIDARLNETADELTGSYRGTTLHLFAEDE